MRDHFKYLPGPKPRILHKELSALLTYKMYCSFRVEELNKQAQFNPCSDSSQKVQYTNEDIKVPNVSSLTKIKKYIPGTFSFVYKFKMYFFNNEDMRVPLCTFLDQNQELLSLLSTEYTLVLN